MYIYANNPDRYIYIYLIIHICYIVFMHVWLHVTVNI
jgi:hypothetical protein